ncbi:MAG: cyclopropane-fatty-acyl-phospholipid synthase [Rhodobacteraceae bacterium]|nr:cyclopropane-fatty-acyl-phospholipid synthase [Paracoccaceae bacterium]MCY4196705.1 cyclopropane-fatty-acyl-phospholipid synthase [Paracoccaceae bacterium]MCY4327421.1 cyclopropane-fatty-acyl-phospholipid synthase [Paracoccaceae bacterium]
MWKSIFICLVRPLIRTGHLFVTFPDGTSANFGNMSADPVSIRFHDHGAIREFCLNPDLALGEIYMDGRLTISNDDIRGFLALTTQNVATMHYMPTNRFWLSLRKVFRTFQQYNPIGKAQSNIRHHYDLTDELYELFLDSDRQYSCAYFTHPDSTLEDAQCDKKIHIAKKLLLEPDHRILDIGSGWGGMGLTLARDYGCSVTGVTLSEGQHRISNQRAEDMGISDRARFELMDYRKVESIFDRIVSVGMFEHVGTPHYHEFFRHLRRLLKDDGVALLHTIGRMRPPGVTNAWIAKYIFPGGYIPAMSEVLQVIEKEGLIVTDIEILRLHYAETLKHWYQRFTSKMDRAKELYDERFCRMWRFYLAGSEMSFRHGGQVVFQFQITKLIDSAPLTRNYLYSLA